ncbi:MAG: hypothetical protein LBV33_07700 [Lachnospiraceae bacterium]|jgi:hypothetical protein|nr:hypothetical protein [Lachnospiraceae bacterium]
MSCKKSKKIKIINYCGCDKNDGYAIPSIGENGNWFIGDEDTGINAKGEVGPTGPQGMQGIPGEKGDKGDLHDTSLIIRPDLWTVGTEYDFGAGLYGQRFTGAITATTETNIITILNDSDVLAICDFGGTYNNGLGSDLGFGSTYASNRSSITESNAVSIKDKRLYITTCCITQRTNAPYDIWIKYTK